MAEKSYYEVLGVSKTASQDDIKRAYRRLARKLHPDLHATSQKSEMEAKFKELNEAYEVLKDPETRKKYDQYGKNWKEAEAYERARKEAGFEQGEWRTGFTEGGAADFEDLFENLFGGRSAGRGGASFRGFGMGGSDIEAAVDVTLREVLTGTSRQCTIEDESACSTCHGTGQQAGGRCQVCRGRGKVLKPKTIEIRIPKGVRHGERLKVPGKGGLGSGGGPRGNLYLAISIKPHRVFHREKQDLLVTVPLWPWEAVLGTTIQVPTLEGPVKLKIPAGSHAGTKLRLKGKGLPDRSGKRGDEFVKITIVVPETVSEAEKNLYEQLKQFPHSDPRQTLLREAAYGS